MKNILNIKSEKNRYSNAEISIVKETHWYNYDGTYSHTEPSFIKLSLNDGFDIVKINKEDAIELKKLLDKFL